MAAGILILIGPATPGFVADAALAGQLAEIGVMLMMFGVGLHFSLEDLWQVRRIALPGALSQIAVASALGMALAHCWGWSVSGGLVFGLALSVAKLFTLCVVAAAVGIAYGSSRLFGVWFALGAFFAGMVLRESELSHRAAHESLPLRDAFAVLFFVSVGMLFDPAILRQQPWQLLAVVAVIVLGKSIAAFALVTLLRYPAKTALVVSASLAQIGEFSFILAALGLSLGLMPAEGQSLILAGAIISIALNPVIFRWTQPLQRYLGNKTEPGTFLGRFFEEPYN